MNHDFLPKRNKSVEQTHDRSSATGVVLGDMNLGEQCCRLLEVSGTSTNPVFSWALTRPRERQEVEYQSHSTTDNPLTTNRSHMLLVLFVERDSSPSSLSQGTDKCRKAQRKSGDGAVAFERHQEQQALNCDDVVESISPFHQNQVKDRRITAGPSQWLQ